MLFYRLILIGQYYALLHWMNVELKRFLEKLNKKQRLQSIYNNGYKFTMKYIKFEPQISLDRSAKHKKKLWFIKIAIWQRLFFFSRNMYPHIST